MTTLPATSTARDPFASTPSDLLLPRAADMAECPDCLGTGNKSQGGLSYYCRRCDQTGRVPASSLRATELQAVNA